MRLLELQALIPYLPSKLSHILVRSWIFETSLSSTQDLRKPRRSESHQRHLQTVVTNDRRSPRGTHTFVNTTSSLQKMSASSAPKISRYVQASSDPASFMVSLNPSSLWGDERFSDATIIMGQKTWRVHRWVICQQSSYFEKALEGHFIVSRIDLTFDSDKLLTS